MSNWGKIVGGATGFALGGPLGAILGAAAGHAVDRLAVAAIEVASADGESDDATKKAAFTVGVIVLGAKMAKADGKVTDDEIAAFRQVFHVPLDEQANVTRLFNIARRDHRGFEIYARQIARMFRGRPAVLEELLLCLFHIAKADGKVDTAELRFLRAVADIFGFDDAEWARIRAEELGVDHADPFNILGIDRTMENAAIKQAFRRLIRENHPDRLVAQGMPQEFIDVANEKMATINAAYDLVRKERGIS
ncbi:MAG: DnaJ domain-containing protein [Inquilinus sp.]|nr:DnaJ domain-containing protein [Inquilinus sp.]